MTHDAPTIPMVAHRLEPYIFVPLEGCGDNTIEFVCSEHDVHWQFDPFLYAEWPGVLAGMREHIGEHH